MTEALADLFRASRGEPVRWEGHEVRMLHQLDGLATGQRLHLRVLQSSAERPQALRLRAREGVLEVNGQQLDDVVLWTATAPPQLQVAVVPHEPAVPVCVRLWNAWQDPAGTMQAWIGNAGLVVDEVGEGVVRLRCSDGFGAPSFDDLVIEVAVS